MDKKKKIIWSLISLLLAGLSIWAVSAQSKDMSPIKLWHSLSEANPKWIFAAILCMFGFIYFEGAAILCITKAIGYKKSQFGGLLYSASDVYFSAITPSASGGQPASAYFMMRDGIPGGVVTVALVVNLIMYTLAIIALGILAVFLDASVYSNFVFFPSKTLIIAGAVVLLGLLFVFVMLLKHGRAFFRIISRFLGFLHRHHLIHKLESKQKKLDKAVVDFENCVSVMSGKTKALIMAFVLNVLQRASQILVSVMVYKAYYPGGQDAVRVFSTQSMVAIGSNCVPVPGAMGVADYLMLDGFEDILTKEQSIHLEMMSRGISFYICILICGLIMVLGYLFRREKDRSIAK
ncbi:MAG: flippase-like domain-containing protein [Eubacterium sp.]|nr:flippase-like domain-containing protein [Eubacterium sp.]